MNEFDLEILERIERAQKLDRLVVLGIGLGHLRFLSRERADELRPATEAGHAHCDVERPTADLRLLEFGVSGE